MTKLRALLEECGIDGSTALTSAFGCYKLTLPSGAWVDVDAAVDAVEQAEAALAVGDLDQARSQATVAAALARRSFLPGEDASWVEERRRDLRDVLVRAVECLRDASFGAGKHAEAVRLAKGVTELEPFRESGYRRLMEAHAAAGNPAEALRVYERCRRFLAEELGAYPSPETKATYLEMLRAERASATQDGPPLAVSRPSRPALVSRSALLLAPVGAVLVGISAAVMAFALQRDGGTSVEPNSLAVIDPSSNRLVDSLSVGVRPRSVAVGGGSVYVANTEDETVSRIDARTRELVRTIAVGEYPSDVTVAAGTAWVALGGPQTIRRISLERGEAEDPLPALATGYGGQPIEGCSRTWTSLTAGAGALWSACNNSTYLADVSRIGLASGRPVRVDDALVSSSPLGVAFSDVAVGLGSVWLTNRHGNVVVEIDAATRRRMRDVTVGEKPEAVAVGFGSVWVANLENDTVSRIDVETPDGPVRVHTIRVGDGPSDVAVGAGAVWAVNRLGGSVSRIDPTTGTITATIELGHEPLRAAVGAGFVWVSVQRGTRESAP
jgi:YVTN family beta-propeller protein